MEREKLAKLLLRLGFTAVLAGYLMVWLPQPVAGLSFIGLEMGEWVKFLPQVQSGEIVPGRNLYYLPPVTLGLMLVLWTAGWPNRRWQTWAMRSLAVAVSLLAFPALEAIQFEPPSQWLLRLFMVSLVIAVVVLLYFADRPLDPKLFAIIWLLMTLLALAGAVLPTWAYVATRPALSQLFGEIPSFGPGFWLNFGGNLVLVIVGVYYLLVNRVGDKRRI